jgi:hypothetical protein
LGPIFIFFASKAKQDGDITSRYALQAMNTYGLIISSWGVLFR